MLTLYPKGDTVNSQIAKAIEVANKVSQKARSIKNDVEVYQRSLLKQHASETPYRANPLQVSNGDISLLDGYANNRLDNHRFSAVTDSGMPSGRYTEFTRNAPVVAMSTNPLSTIQPEASNLSNSNIYAGSMDLLPMQQPRLAFGKSDHGSEQLHRY